MSSRKNNEIEVVNLIDTIEENVNIIGNRKRLRMKDDDLIARSQLITLGQNHIEINKIGGEVDGFGFVQNCSNGEVYERTFIDDKLFPDKEHFYCPKNEKFQHKNGVKHESLEHVLKCFKTKEEATSNSDDSVKLLKRSQMSKPVVDVVPDINHNDFGNTILSNSGKSFLNDGKFVNFSDLTNDGDGWITKQNDFGNTILPNSGKSFLNDGKFVDYPNLTNDDDGWITKQKRPCYRCDRCESKFVEFKQFKKHLHGHMEKNIKCQFCNKKYWYNSHLTQHIRRCHL